jgi:hypothetical protein
VAPEPAAKVRTTTGIINFLLTFIYTPMFSKYAV